MEIKQKTVLCTTSNMKKADEVIDYFSTEVWKIGKSKSGNLLDGKQHLAFPA